ncbi:hypothetical protein B9K09_11990 [Pseudomonas sp. M30-35]|nr:hypothetical protein B9K09_11990 [Pseudomonas sp. M30-35]
MLVYRLRLGIAHSVLHINAAPPVTAILSSPTCIPRLTNVKHGPQSWFFLSSNRWGCRFGSPKD